MLKVNTPILRQFLWEAFSFNDFTQFCYEYFPQVYKEFNDDIIISHKIQLILEYCHRHNQWEYLLSSLQAERKVMYAIYQEAITVPGINGVFANDLASYDATAESSLLRLMPPSSTYFVGRQTLLNEIVAQLTSSSTEPAMTLAITGPGGIGKSALAIALARDERVQHYFSGVLWAELGTHADILTLLAAWGQALGDDSVEKLVGLEARQKAVRRVIGQQRFLLILDDVWQAEDVLAMQCGGANCRMLVTTRDTAVAQTVATAARIQPIEPLTKADALTLLQTMAPKAWATNTTAITQLAESVGGLPLALALLGGYLAIPEWGDLTGLNQPAKGLADIKQRLALAQRQLKGKQQVTVTKLVALSLASLPPTAIAAWIALGAFASKPASFIQPAAVAVARTDGRTLELLLACHLLERTKDGLTLPRILADVARTMLVPWSKISPLPPPAPKQPNRSWRITRPTIRLVEGAAIEPLTQQTAVERHRTYYIKLITGGDWRWIDGAYKQIQWAWLQLPNEEVASWVRYIRGYQLKQRSEHEFLVWAKRGLLAARAVKNRKDESIMLNYIGEICHNWRRFSEAMRFYDQALSIKQELNDKIGEHDVRYNIAQVFKEQGLLTEAVAEMTQVMALTNRFYKESDIDELRHMERMLKKSSWAKLGP